MQPTATPPAQLARRHGLRKGVVTIADTARGVWDLGGQREILAMGTRDETAQAARIEKCVHPGGHLDAETQRVVIAADTAKGPDAWARVNELVQGHGAVDRIRRNVDFDR